jgi:hypothetical protein
MSQNHQTNQETGTQAAAVDLPQPAPTLTPDAVVERLRALRGEIGEVAPLTVAQRRTLRNRARASASIQQASLSVLGALDNVSQAIGQPAADVRQLYDEATHWSMVEDELRAMLNGIAGANLIRRDHVARVAAQAFAIGVQLARDPANAVLVPHLQEVKRLKGFKKRKRAPRAPAAPPSPPAGTPAPVSVTPKSLQE